MTCKHVQEDTFGPQIAGLGCERAVSRRQLLKSGCLAIGGAASVGTALTAVSCPSEPAEALENDLREDEREFLGLWYTSYVSNEEATLRFIRPRGIYSWSLAALAYAFDLPLQDSSPPPSTVEWPWKTRAEFDALLKRGRNRVLQKYDLPDIPLTDIVERAGLSRSEAQFLLRWILEYHDFDTSYEEERTSYRWYPTLRQCEMSGWWINPDDWLQTLRLLGGDQLDALVCLSPEVYEPVSCPWSGSDEYFTRRDMLWSSAYLVQARERADAQFHRALGQVMP